MTKYYRCILIDQRTSCTRDEAAAILLGRRTFDPIYQDLNYDADPEEVHQEFMDWLNLSIFSDLIDERESIQIELDDALEEEDKKKIDAAKFRIMQCDTTIRKAKQALCDIDDELAKGSDSQLRLDKVATEKFNKPCITLSSLKAWADSRPKPNENNLASHIQPVPPENKSLPEGPLLDAKGCMSAPTANRFLVTFALLREAFLAIADRKFKSESGNAMNAQVLAEHLSQRSMPGARSGKYLQFQSVSAIENRFKEVVNTEASEVSEQHVQDVIDASEKALIAERSKNNLIDN